MSTPFGWKSLLVRHLPSSRPVRHAALFVALLLANPAAAQQSATVAGVVRSQSGIVLSGVRITIAPGNAVGVTNASGAFVLRVRTDTVLELHAEQFGFIGSSLHVDALASGARRSLAITLVPVAALSVMNVIATPPRALLNTQNASTGGSLERAQLQALPTDARDPISLAYTIPGVAPATGFFGDAPRLSFGGANALYSQYLVDGLDNNEGFLGGPRVELPLSALGRLDVLANTYSSEYGRSPSGVVDMRTRAGTDTAAGEFFAYSRPGISANVLGLGNVRFDARSKSPLSTDARAAENGFMRSQFGGSYGAPLVANRTVLFVAAEYTNENEDRIASTASARFVGRETRETWKTFGRLDQGWTPQQITTVRFAMSNVNRAGQGGGITAPEADITTERIGSITSLTHRSVLRGGGAVNNASVQIGTFRWNFPPTKSGFDTPQVTILNRDSVPIGIAGSSNFVFDEREVQLQLKNVFETAIGVNHHLRIGADVTRSAFQLRGSSTNPSGAYEVVNHGNIPVGANGWYSIADIPANVFVRSYTIDAAQKQVNLSQLETGAYVEDRWRPSSALTINAGLRWDYDDLTSRGNSAPDLNNFQPRVSVNWLATPRAVLRAGAGLYAGKFPYAVYSDAIQFGLNGNQTVSFRGPAAPAFLQGPKSAQLNRSALPPGEVRQLFALGLQQPMSRQYTVGYQRELGRRVGITLDGVYVDTRNLPRSWDLNASTRRIGPSDTIGLPVSVGDAFRPVTPVAGGYRRLTTTETGGRSTYAALYTTATLRATNTVLLDLNWVWSRARNNTEDINFNATQGNDFGAEWADAVNDRRHSVATRVVYSGVSRLTLSSVLSYQSGQPVNRIANFKDLDGSGDTFGNGFLGNQDRYFGVPRNGERLSGSWLTNASAAYLVPLPRGNIELRADAFNLLNATLESGYANGIPGGGARTQVGRPGDPLVISSFAPPRQLQLSARWVF
jgi:outer membrane receptor protein involved in Fe transport